MKTLLNCREQAKELILAISNKRTRDVIVRRFGLNSGKVETLESIGRSYGITRERVRQIEADGLKFLGALQQTASRQNIYNTIEDHFVICGQVISRDNLFNLVNGSSDLTPENAALNLILSLNDSFSNQPEGDEYFEHWTNSQENLKLAYNVIGAVYKSLKKHNKVLVSWELYNFVNKAMSPIGININQKVIDSYLSISRIFNFNVFGEFGLSHWPEIKPRGVKDKAFLVFKKEQRPIHFSELTSIINKYGFAGRLANAQTVHNELIKDKRFVLVGRGTYALSSWGYEPGTVRDVILSIFKKSARSLDKEEIIKKVLEKRIVKENTILLNIQNKNYFSRDKNGLYSLIKRA